MHEHHTLEALTAARTLMAERGGVELWFDHAEDAAQWRELMRRQARVNGTRINTFAKTVDTGVNAGRTIAAAWRPDRTEEERRESARRAMQILVNAGFGA